MYSICKRNEVNFPKTNKMKTKYGINTEDKIFIHDKKLPNLLRFCINCAMRILTIWYYLLIGINSLKGRKNKKNKKHYFSICAIFKNEDLVIKEWIEYHLLLGVDHFYLYNNNSTDNFQNILNPYIEKEIVSLIEWNFAPPSQFSAYENFYNNFWEENQWVAFIDLDEFICPYRELTIKDWIKKFEKYGSVSIYWKQFGTSGKINNDDSQLVIEQYTICWDKLFAIGKTFVNTNFAIKEFSAKNLHAMSTTLNLFGVDFSIPPINEFKKFIRFKSNRVPVGKRSKEFSIQINHYGSKSYYNFIYNKINRGDVNNHVRDVETFFWGEQYNTTCDYKIFRFMIELKINMGMAQEVQNLLLKNRSDKTL